MAKLSISEASRVAGVSRVTLHRYIKAGKLRQQTDGKVDSADLTTAGFVLHPETLHSPIADATPATPHVTPATPVTVVPDVDYRERYTTLLEQEMERLHQEVDRLHRELEALRDEGHRKEQVLQEYQSHVLQMFQEQRQLLQQMQQRLLEAPRPAPPPAPPAAPEVVRELLRRRPYADLPEVENPPPVPLQDPNRHARRQRILEALAAYPEGLHWKEIGRLIGDPGDLNDTLQGMLRYKLVRRVGRGVYALPVIG
jgi:hypothetical protein